MIAPADIIRPTSCEKLLSSYIRKDMPWIEYIKLNKESLMKSLNLRLRAVKKIRYLTTFKNRKMIAEGISMSKVSYLITLWGGCNIDLQKFLPTLQNKAAQAVTRCDCSVTEAVW